MRQTSMKPSIFYALTLIAVANLVIGFINQNTLMLVVAFVLAFLLKPHLKFMPIPKSYLKLAGIEEENLTIEQLRERGREAKKNK